MSSQSSEPPLRPADWADIVIAKLAEATWELPIEDDQKPYVRMLVTDALTRLWPPYALNYTGPRTACGCPDRPDEDYKAHPGEPCDWSHWHPNPMDAMREDRFCWRCGGMEWQRIGGST